MELNDNIDLTKRKFTSQLIVKRALHRGWTIKGFETNPAIFLLYVPGRPKPVKIFSASPSQMSYPASKIAKDKFITNRILAEEGITVPDELLFRAGEDSITEAVSFLSKHKKIVVKPLDASHGNGITVAIDSITKLKRAIEQASRAAAGNKILIQQQVEGHDIRVLCIDYAYVNAISRIPASVIGDGQHTVAALIEMTNQHPDRGENYAKKLNVIPSDKAEEFLGKRGMQRIPAQDEEVQVIGVSNIGMGGVRKNITENIPDFLKEIACSVAKTLELPVCGVDFMVKRLPRSQDTISELQPYIIEVNECPMLTMYDDLNSPEQYAVIDRYLDFVAED